ncbi:MAG: hypothetical protein ACLFRB_04125 [Thiohalorhabdus sp.]|uniref:hypothetical protein n=1 Tax=Thiohalorhabdus sp. TaxID=3094134 RepID=UPI00397F472D
MRKILLSAVLALAFLAAPAQAMDMELYSGDTFEYAETSEDENFVYADLTFGGELLLLPFFDGCCNIDILVAVIEPESMSFFSDTIESGENVYTETLSTGETVYIASLEGVLYTEGQIGVMADRIGEMADRIVYTEELIVETENLIVDVTRFSQANLLTFVDMLNPLKILE